MEKSILNFNKQFEFEPEIQNAEHLKDFDHVIFCGMGGSHLAADVIKTIKPGIDIYVHKDYDLPPYEEDFLKRALLIACSYSGETEETLSFFNKAYDKEYLVAVISCAGQLLEEAKSNHVPYIEIPNTGIQPRQAVGYMSLAILKIMGDEDTIYSWSLLKERIKPKDLKNKAESMVSDLQNKIPIIYSSSRNLHISNIWKIKLNETAKVPAFYNVFPELNHNELQSMDLDEKEAKKFHVIFIFDEDDHPQIQKRMNITKDLYEERQISTSSVVLDDKTREEKVFNTILLADWVSLLLAQINKKDPEKVPLIQEFKKRLVD